MKPSEVRIETLLKQMTLEEKLGQMSQCSVPSELTPEFEESVRKGRYGSVYGACHPSIRARLMQVSRDESRLKIPLIIGEDVIHGFITGQPIPLGQAATWDPELVRQAAAASAREASSCGIQWTFSPMIDVARDPRWGRVAEGYGEDPYLTGVMGAATIAGYQGENLSDPTKLAACAKHYVGYGAAEGGRDYNATWIPEGQLRDIYLKPFHAAKEAGVATMMSAFNTINGVSASANSLTLRKILRDEWGFDGFVVSDYQSVHELIEHGNAFDGADAAHKAIHAGVSMEMVSQDYFQFGPDLVSSGKLDISVIDNAVREILRVKLRMGLFDVRPQPNPVEVPTPTTETLTLARKTAAASIVLLKNERAALPLIGSTKRIAVIGALANGPADQLGTWANAHKRTSVTPLEALRDRLGADNVAYAAGSFVEGASSLEYLDPLVTSRSRDGFADAIAAASSADVILVFLGETAGMSGEAHCRAYLDLPGIQAELTQELAALGKPIIGIVQAGRPLAFVSTLEHLDACLFAWHGGSMAGPAIVDVLLGDIVPSGKLPITFPRTVGQIPIYYSHLNTGRPASETGDAVFDPYRSKYLDSRHTPLFPFGYGMSYTTFEYSASRSLGDKLNPGEVLCFEADITNTGQRAGTEVVQFYTRQMTASVARPVRELRGFARVELKPGETKTVSFELKESDMAFTNANMQLVTEPGTCLAWISPDSVSGEPIPFELC